MVAIRPPAVKGTAGQKFVVTRRFSGDGHELVIGDVIVAKPEWTHKIPMLVDQRFISPFLSEEDEQKVPVNLELAEETKVEEVKETVPAKVVTPKAVVVSEVELEGEGQSGDGKEGTGDPEQEEIDALAASLLI